MYLCNNIYHDKMKYLRILSLIALLHLSCQQAFSGITIPQFFDNHMVLQRGRCIPIWGNATPGSRVKVTLCGKTRSCKADADGKWRIELPKLDAGGPYDLTITDGKMTAVLKDVMIGDVFLCSGEANMELPIDRCMDVVAKEVEGYENTRVRYMNVSHQYNFCSPQTDMNTNGWQALNAQSTPQMSALCYYVGRTLQEEKNVPIGIINSSVERTRIEAWMSREALLQADNAYYTQVLAHEKFHNPDWPGTTAREEFRAMSVWDRLRREQPVVSQEWVSQSAFSPFGGDTPDGEYCLRQQVTLTPAQAKGQPLLRLGIMRDADSVFVNGTCVGTTASEFVPRKYIIPEGILHEGENTIEVHLFSYNGKPGFTQGKQYQVETAKGIIPLQEAWEMRRISTMPPLPHKTYFYDTPTALYNAMIAPLADFPLAAIVWYQGESDCDNAETYGQRLQMMTRCWRKLQRHDTPLLVVQLAGYQDRHKQPAESNIAMLRQQQRLAVEAIPHAAMCSAIDIGEWNDLHPQTKNVLGRRAALALRGLVYGEQVVTEGPRIQTAQMHGDKGEVTLTFDPLTGVLRDAPSYASIAIEDTNGYWHWVEATKVGPYTLSLRPAAGIVLPKHPRIRYAWDDNPVNSLYNEEGLPAASFEIQVR